MHWVLLEIPASGRDPATTWIAISVGVLAVVYVTLVKPLRTKKKKDPLESAPFRTGLSQQRGVEREMSNLLVELSEMARQMTAQLDTRAAKLELLLKDADQRIAMLRGLGAGERAATNFQADSAAANGAGDGVIAEARAPGSPSISEQKLDPRHAKVYGLADEGHSPQEIARQLDRPSGEIELILALRSDDAR